VNMEQHVVWGGDDSSREEEPTGPHLEAGRPHSAGAEQPEGDPEWEDIEQLMAWWHAAEDVSPEMDQDLRRVYAEMQADPGVRERMKRHREEFLEMVRAHLEGGDQTSEE